MGLSSYPAGVDNSHSRFHEPYRPDVCPDCGADVGDEVYCQRCGAVFDPDEADAIARELEDDRLVDEAGER